MMGEKWRGGEDKGEGEGRGRGGERGAIKGKGEGKEGRRRGWEGKGSRETIVHVHTKEMATSVEYTCCYQINKWSCIM